MQVRARSGRGLAAALAVAGALAAAPLARADSIVVNGRELKGEIVAETSDSVTIKAGGGTLTIPRRAITAIHREDEATTLLGEARELARNGDRACLSLLERAVAALRRKGDTATADAAEAELQELTKRFASEAARPRSAPARPGRSPRSKDSRETDGDDLFLLVEDAQAARALAHDASDPRAPQAAHLLASRAAAHASLKEFRWEVGCWALANVYASGRFAGQEAAARRRACGQAIQVPDARIAKAALEPLLATPRDGDVDLFYLEGRVAEIDERPGDAAAAYRRALAGRDIPGVESLPADLLAQLVRLQALGMPVGPESPGVGAGWTRAASATFVVYHKLDPNVFESELARLDDARTAVLEKLGVAAEEVAPGGAQFVFLFDGHEAFVRSGAEQWAAGHAYGKTFADGPHWTIASYPGRDQIDVMKHELAHAYLHVALPDLEPPVWAGEGAATLVESDRARAYYRTILARAYGNGAVAPLATFLEGTGGYPTEQQAINAFYARSCVVTAVLADAAGGVVPALRVAAKMPGGAEKALADLGITVDDLEARVKTFLQNQGQ